ncbi:hypothetical protein D3877_10310 [Azospirillum cavernae]|uniref:ArsR family transcriptional regulator n=1 Tax=Azospirillum cavernae TaxID=2320860 RepID=A0A418W4B9_9PROT|nr:hypothetical protein [Azospirillum cavernae]RJF84862.1 hypothetical protein D3877_10310 [Azospirillum cavernae]
MSNTNFLAHLAEDRRLVILRLLTEAGGTANDSVLEAGLQQLGHRRGLTRDVVRADIDWLKARRLVAVEMVKDTVMVASITERGLNVAEGHETVDGVKRPSLV